MAEYIASFFNTIGNILSPIAYGALFTFLLSPLYTKLCKKMHKVLSSIICLLVVFAAVAALSLLIIPQVVNNIGTFINQIPEFITAFDKMTENLFAGDPELHEMIESSYSGLQSSIVSWITGEFIPNITKYATSIGSSIWSVVNSLKNFIIGTIVMVYLLNMKDTLKAQAKKIAYSWFSIEKANVIIDDCRFASQVFTGFISGKIVDSIIIGILTFIVISIFGIPYSVLIAVIVGITNIIPFFGPFIGAIPCAFLLLLVSPVKCLEFVIIILVIQQLDGNFIGPKILGNVTGVPSFWVLISILVFGGLFGIVGMIIAVPAFAVIFRICKRRVYARLKKKDMPVDTENYDNLESIDPETKEIVKHTEESINNKKIKIFNFKRRDK